MTASRRGTRQRDFEAQEMHSRAAGIASSRASLISPPHDSQRPYVPASSLARASSMSLSVSVSVPASASISPRSAVTWLESANPSSNASDPFGRSEEHTSELQSREKLVCRLLLEKKKRR